MKWKKVSLGPLCCFVRAVSCTPATAADAAPRLRTLAWVAGGIVFAVGAVYIGALSAPFVFDDLPAVARAARIVQAGEPWQVLLPGPDAGETTSGRPLLSLTLALNYALGGEAAGGFRLVNVLIHALASLTLFGLVRRTLRRASFPERVRTASLPLAAGAATLWALHPLQTQAVTYVVQRAESLAGLFLLLTLYTFVRSIDSPRAQRWQGLSIACCLLGAATKEVIAAAPLVVLLYDRTFVAGSFRAAFRSRRVYYGGLAATWLLLALLVAGTGGRGGTAGFDAGVHPWHYFLTQAHAIVHYLRLSLWPHPLIFDYGTEVVRAAADVLLPLSLLTGLTVLTLHGIRRGTAWGFLGGFFFAVLAPSSSVIPVASQTLAEHRMYLALAAPILFLVVGLHARLGRVVWFLGAPLLLASGWLTNDRNKTYHSELALWSDTVAKRPLNGRAHHNLGLAEFQRGRFAEAAQHFEQAVQLNPGTADSHYNLGLALARLGQPAEAVAHYERALARQPHHASALNNLGNALLALDRLDEARAHYDRALRIEPNTAEVHSNLSDVLLRTGETGAALHHAREAIRLNPSLAEARLHAGNACAHSGLFTEARRHFEAAVLLQPDDARMHNNLANVLIELGFPAEAVARYERALELEPEFVDARRNLAFLLLNLDRPAAAEPHLDRLARQFPANREFAQALREIRALLLR